MVNDTGKPAILHEMFALHCEVAGVVDSIHWFRNGQLVYTDKTTVLALDNRTLILIPVQHSDNGDYYCQAFNYVSNMTSSPYTLQVNCKYFYLPSIALCVFFYFTLARISDRCRN